MENECFHRYASPYSQSSIPSFPVKGREKVNFVLSSVHSFFFIFRMGNLALLNETLDSQQVIHAKTSDYT